MTTAEVQEHTPPPVAPPPAPEPTPAPARRLGRRAAAEQADATGESSAEEQIGYFQQIAEIPEVDWERTCQYLYRWQPYYDNTKGGIEPKYVCLYTQSVTVDQIKREHGSGRYNLKLNQRAKTERSDKTIRQIVFDILDPAYPPNLPDGDWKQDPRNKKWVWGKAEAPQAGPQGTTMANSVKEIQALVQTLYPNLNQPKSAVEAELVKILPALLEQRNGQQLDPMQMITAVVTLIKTMTPAPVAPPPQDNTMTQFILQQLNAANERAEKQNQLIITLITAKNEVAKPPDAMDMLDRMAGIFGKVSDVRESLGVGGGASRMNGWQEVLSNVGTEVVKHVGPAIPFFMQQRARQAAAPPQQPRPIAAPGAAPNPAPAPTAAAPAPTAAAPVPTEEEQDNMDAASFLAQQMRNLGIVGPLLNYFNDGETGLRFACWIVDGNGATPLNLIKGQGKTVVMKAITEHIPELYAQLQPNWGKFDLFVDSFLSWTPDAQAAAALEDNDDEDDDEDSDEEDTLPVSTAAPGAPPSGTPPAPPRGAAPAPARAAKPAAPKKAAAKKKAVKK